MSKTQIHQVSKKVNVYLLHIKSITSQIDKKISSIKVGGRKVWRTNQSRGYTLKTLNGLPGRYTFNIQ